MDVFVGISVSVGVGISVSVGVGISVGVGVVAPPFEFLCFFVELIEKFPRGVRLGGLAAVLLRMCE